MRSRVLLSITALLAISGLLAACGSGTDNGTAAAGATTSGAASAPDGPATSEVPTNVRLAYFPNLTHASAIVGVERGIFAEKLGANKLETKLFNAGPDVVTAIFADAIDVAYIGPNPTINAYAKSGGNAIRIVSGATSAGALFITKPDIRTAADLKGHKIATPQLGGTQDVAARNWLKSQGLKTDTNGGGDISVVPQENAQTLDAFKTGQIDGAWVPEPWATRLVLEGGGKVFLDEKSLWPSGQFVTTHIIVSTKFLKAHPDAVRRLIEGQVAASDWINNYPQDARKTVNDGITKYTGKAIAPAVIDGAWKNLTFTNDPVASSLTASAKAAEGLGLLPPTKLDGIYDLTLLNGVLRASGAAPVAES